MNAQTLYDLREKYEFCSGTDLSDFFQRALYNPAPFGKTELSDGQKWLAHEFVTVSLKAMAHNSPSLKSWAMDTLEEIRREVF